MAPSTRSATATAAMAVVHAPQPPKPSVEDCFSDKVQWDPTSNTPMTIGALQTPCDIARFIQKFFPPGVTVYDVLQFLLAECDEFISAQKEEEGLPKLYSKIRSLLCKSESDSHKIREDNAEYQCLMARFIEPFNFYLSNYEARGEELISKNKEIASLKRALEEHKRIIDHVKDINHQVGAEREQVSTAALRAARGSPLRVMPTMKDAFHLATRELARAGSELVAQKSTIPQSMAITAEYLHELERFLLQVEKTSRDISGGISEAALHRSGLLRIARSADQIHLLESALANKNAFPREPFPPHRFLLVPPDGVLDVKRSGTGDEKVGKPVKKPRMSV
ncbi:hypothetical protein PQX77_021193 [Marasmius sp. AFHP31]|nr:hypothetical protein PQX77_021193 [Marasmius sp. AFHP31]